AGGGGDVLGHARLRNADRLSDQPDGLWSRRLPLHGLHAGGHPAEHSVGAAGLPADPGVLAAASMIRRALLLCLALAACGPAGGPPPGRGQAQPSRVILYADTVTVEMSDRAFCTGPRTGPGTAWSGRLAGCPHLWPYQVQQPAFRFARLPL